MTYDLTFAVIGTGFMGKTHAEIISRLAKRMIICGNDCETGKALAEQYGCPFYADYREMLTKELPDAVSVCLPTHLHAEATIAALEAGANVLCEKPFASSVEEAERMIAASEKNARTLMIAHCCRFSKKYEYLRRCINDARFGNLISLDLHRDTPKPAWSVGNWLANVALSGGVVRDLHIHDTDIVVGLLGMPTSIYTVGGATACRTVYRYENDLSVSASASWRDIENIRTESGFDATFEHACIQAEGGTLKLYTDNSCTEPLENEEFSEFFQGESSYENEIAYFCDCLAKKESPVLCPVSDSLKTIRLSCAESRSLEKKTLETL